MSYGLQIWDAAGRKTFDSLTSTGGVFLGTVTMAEGSSGSVTYSDSDVQGRTLVCIEVGAGTHNWSTGSSAGYPQLSWSPRPSPGSGVTGVPGDTKLLVFAR